MEVFVGKEAYNFTAKAVLSNNTIEDLFNLKSYLNNSKGILFFYPLNFTFVCPSEIIAFSNKSGKFLEKNTKIVGVSVDSWFSHLAWKNTPYSKGGIDNINFPLVSDLNTSISKAYGVRTEGGMALRGTFIIDEDFILRHITINDLNIGRSIDESLRIVDMIDHCKKSGEVCPVGWSQGDESMKPTTGGVADYLTTHAKKL